MVARIKAAQSSGMQQSGYVLERAHSLESGVHIVLEHGLERLFASFGVRDAGDPCKGDERF